MNLSIIILAAGLGKRMQSNMPKVLHQLAEKPLVRHVVDAISPLEYDKLHIIYGHKGELVRESLSDVKINWAEQKQQLGTGHAVMQAMPAIPDDHLVLILCGDIPLIQTETLATLCSQANENNLSMLTVQLDNPQGYGRIIRDENGQIQKIVEEKDTNSEQKQIKEVNAGIYAIPAVHLRRWLQTIDNNNSQGEYYLTDIIALAKQDKIAIQTTQAHNNYEVMGINDRIQLANLERYYQLQQANNLMLAGVSLADPNRLDVRGTIQAGRDISIDINVILAGTVILGNRVQIGANTIIRNTQIDDDVEILSNCVIENVIIGKQCRIGPFARLRPDTILSEQVHIGNFVELKKSIVAQGSKINHLSYIGDTEVGKAVNIGAGTITCNYDGANKYKTVIEDNAFIGSDTQLVAPVTVGKGSTIGAGSTITKNTLSNELTLSRSSQKTIIGWQRPTKKS
ncbi:MAG: bifunctional UDP-N-acetylglucosamine diphosphorylase/glucosamine-1-phosphate N-acetyltransferase GlmU [Thiomargarita sp.]|nr:bifunctional UDP-N-acetylglucosamine diphosphorylase/glucosamine-1-phosphate N-acetyltransferase GlmU [Thiomargarita sp.]